MIDHDVYASRRTATDPKAIARREVQSAFRHGTIANPGRCERCGTTEGRIVGHHEDYAKPLDLVWLCCPCHHTRHTEMAPPRKATKRCAYCRRLIFLHVEESGHVRMTDEGLVHRRCRKKGRKKAPAMPRGQMVVVETLQDS